MTRIDSNVVLEASKAIPLKIQLPELDSISIIVNNLPFIITIFIVASSAFVTWLSYKKSIVANRDSDHQNKISEFRHNWLQELRNTSSLLVEHIHMCNLYSLRLNQARDWRGSALESEDSTSVEYYQAEINKYDLLFIESQKKFYHDYTKLKLLFKNNDICSEYLFTLLDEIHSKINSVEHKHISNEEIDKIITELRSILKDEWETTKERTWLKRNRGHALYA